MEARIVWIGVLNMVKDSCYYSVKSRFKVFPSARASQAIAKCRKAHGHVRKTKEGSNLKRWQAERWKNTRAFPAPASPVLRRLLLTTEKQAPTKNAVTRRTKGNIAGPRKRCRKRHPNYTPKICAQTSAPRLPEKGRQGQNRMEPLCHTLQFKPHRAPCVVVLNPDDKVRRRKLAILVKGEHGQGVPAKGRVMKTCARDCRLWFVFPGVFVEEEFKPRPLPNHVVKILRDPLVVRGKIATVPMAISPGDLEGFKIIFLHDAGCAPDPDLCPV